MIVPYDHLSPEALRALLEDIVTRDGTDYGETEVATGTKVDQVLRALRRGEVSLVFDEGTETVGLLPRESLPVDRS